MQYEPVRGDSAIIVPGSVLPGDFEDFVCLSDVWDPYAKFLFTSCVQL